MPQIRTTTIHSRGSVLLLHVPILHFRRPSVDISDDTRDIRAARTGNNNRDNGNHNAHLPIVNHH